MAKPSQPRILVAIPAYNEERYIGSVILKAQQYADEVIVLDDGSIDDTSEIARLAGATVMRHEENKGYGAAIQSLLAEAKKKNPDILVLLDADSQHNPEDIPPLIKPILEGFDLVVGSREQQKVKIPAYRRIGQRVLSYLSGILSRKKLSDSESGFRVFSKKAITVLEPRENGMAVSAETIADAAEKGLKITEVPISIVYTKDGSTLNPIRHGLGVLARILAMISERRPLFFFGLGGGILATLGLIAGVMTLNILSAGGIMPTGTALLSVLLLTIGVFSIFTGIILHTLAGRKG
ncbi:Undecaprenyl-phosphate 4-deoxy-4-formamido-L-arabinose transferase [subsurface metagenome]